MKRKWGNNDFLYVDRGKEIAEDLPYREPTSDEVAEVSADILSEINRLRNEDQPPEGSTEAIARGIVLRLHECTVADPGQLRNQARIAVRQRAIVQTLASEGITRPSGLPPTYELDAWSRVAPDAEIGIPRRRP